MFTSASAQIRSFQTKKTAPKDSNSRVSFFDTWHWERLFGGVEGADESAVIVS